MQPLPSGSVGPVVTPSGEMREALENYANTLRRRMERSSRGYGSASDYELDEARARAARANNKSYSYVNYRGCTPFEMEELSRLFGEVPEVRGDLAKAVSILEKAAAAVQEIPKADESGCGMSAGEVLIRATSLAFWIWRLWNFLIWIFRSLAKAGFLNGAAAITACAITAYLCRLVAIKMGGSHDAEIGALLAGLLIPITVLGFLQQQKVSK